MSKTKTEAATRWAGALAVLVAASALIGIPAAEARADVLLAVHAIMQLGCAAVVLSLAPGAVAGLARRGTAGLSASAERLVRWLGFAGITLYSVYVAGDVAVREEAAAAATSLDTVKGFLLFLVFLVGVWAVYLSMVRGRGGPPPWPAPAAEAEASLDSVEVFLLFLIFLAGVWVVYLSVVTMDTGRGVPVPPPAAAAEEDPDGGEVDAMAPRL